MKFIVDKVLGIFAPKYLDGYKTKIGGTGMILLGITALIGRYFPDYGLPVMSFEDAWALIVGGFAVLGIGGKLDKQEAALKVVPPK